MFGSSAESNEVLLGSTPLSGRGHSAGQARTPGQPNRPSSGRGERDRQYSDERDASVRWGEDFGTSGLGNCRRGTPQGHSADGANGLMPIVQRSALTGPATKMRFGGGADSAELQERAPGKPFRRRIGSNKSSPGSSHKSQPRIQQLAVEGLQSDSPKGLDRALTPSMLKAVRKSATEDGSSSASGRVTLFQTSFSRRLSSTEKRANYENLTASFTEGLVTPDSKDGARERASSARAGLSSSSFGHRHPETPFRNSSEGDLQRLRITTPAERETPDAEVAATAETLRPLSRPSSAKEAPTTAEIQSEEDLSYLGAEQQSAGMLIPGDHVQQLVDRNSLSISTSRPLHSDDPSDDAFSIRTEGGQKKPCKQIRCNITRISKRSLLGLSKPAIFELYNMKGRLKMYAERDSGGQISFSIFAPTDEEQKKRVEASLVASTFVENQFLLIGTDPASPAAACDPDQDPVIMAVAFGKSPAGLRTVTALLPDQKPSSAGSNDLGSKQHVSAYFTRLASGETIKNVKVLRSIPGKELRGARFSRGSVKNVQMQVANFGAEWPGATPKSSETISASFMGHKKHAPPEPSRVVFEFGRLRHGHEFVCDYESPTLSAVQALGLAVACSAPKRAFLYL